MLTKLRILICSLLLMSGFVFFIHSFANAAEVDILSGKTFIYANGSATNGNATDHDSSTFLPMNTSKDGTNSITYDFHGKVATISKMRINFENAPGSQYPKYGVNVAFYNSSGGQLGIYAFDPSGDRTIDFSKNPYKNVASFKLYKVSSSDNSYLYDLEMYGDVNYVFPSNLVGTSDSKSVDLKWNPIPDPDLTGFNIYKDGTKLNAKPIPTNEYKVTGLIPDNSYEFYVTAVYGNYETIGSNKVKVISYDDPPEKPVITAESKQNSILLKWTSARAVSFYLFYVNGQLITVTSDRQYEVTGLDLNQVYSFYVVAYDKYGRSSYSDVVSFSTKTPPPPVAPKITVSSKTFSDINIFWDQVGLYYEVYLDGNLKKQTVGNIYNFDQLSPDTEYEIKVVSTDAYNQKAETVLKVKTNALPPIKNPTLRLSASGWNFLEVDWDDVGTWYEVFVNGASAGQTTVSLMTINNLTEDTDYVIEVVSTDNYGRTAKGTLKTKTPSIPKPVDLKLGSLGLSDTALRLTWNDVKAAPYTVYQDGVDIGRANNLFYQLSGLTPDTDYSFKVTYVDGFGRVVESNVLNVHTKPKPSPGNGGGGGSTPRPSPTPPPPVSNSNNPQLNQGNDHLVQGAKDSKESFMKLIGPIIAIILLVFGFFWLVRLFKRKMNKAATTSIGAASKLNLSEGQRAERKMNSERLNKTIRDYHTKSNNKNTIKAIRKVSKYATDGKFQKR